jgi:hypothetical protein
MTFRQGRLKIKEKEGEAMNVVSNIINGILLSVLNIVARAVKLM